MRVKINSFYYKSLGFQGATETDLSPEEVRALVEANLDKKTPGAQAGSWAVPLPGELFRSPTKALTPDTPIEASFEARREGEDLFLKVVTPSGEKGVHPVAEGIIYEVPKLKEDCEREAANPRDFYEEGDHEFEMVIHKSPRGEPLDLATMVRNQLVLKGGTPAHYSSEEWCQAALFWLTHIRIR